MKYEITKEQLRSLTDPKVKEMFPESFIEPTFEYLEEVEASCHNDFSDPQIVHYGCKDPMGGYCCFTKIYKRASKWTYIKKIKQLTSLKNSIGLWEFVL